MFINIGNVSGTRLPYILDTNALVIGYLVGIVGFVIFFLLLGDSSDWGIFHYFKDVLIFMVLLYWIHSSEQISGFSMRRLIQSLTNNFD